MRLSLKMGSHERHEIPFPARRTGVHLNIFLFLTRLDSAAKADVHRLFTRCSHGTEFFHRMDRSHIQSVVGLYQGVSSLRQLLCRAVGEANGAQGVGKQCGTTVLFGSTLEGAAKVE